MSETSSPISGGTAPIKDLHTSGSTSAGVLMALAAFGAWGFMPVLFKAMQQVPPQEILAHRVVWTMLGVGLALVVVGQGRVLAAIVTNRRLMARLAVSTVFITTNWLLFIWAVNNNHMLQASLGYYINPILNVLLGVVVLKERLSVLQWLAVGLVAAALLAFTSGLGVFPWISVVLGMAFALYGLARKTMPVGAAPGLAIETLILFVPAAVYLIYLGANGEGAFLSGPLTLDLLLIAAGVATAIPLILFAGAARRLKYATVGFFQYITPTLQFLLAVYVYGEAFTDAHVLTFVLIWIGIGIYTLDTMRRRG
jgi:chloramphenicol-sensitive protein RarD